MTREEFRTEIYLAYIKTNSYDPVLTQEYIKIAEAFVFDNKQFSRDDEKSLIERLSKKS